jgi:hypothetical protein
MQQKFQIQILDVTERTKFDARFGFCWNTGFVFHSFLISLLESMSDSKEEYDWQAMRCQFGNYTDSDDNTRFFTVSEPVFRAFYDLRMSLRKSMEEFAETKKAEGSNFLIQQIQSDILGEAVSKQTTHIQQKES